MSQLLLIAGFKDGCDINKVRRYIKKTFRYQNVVEVWMDPHSESRAVVLFNEQIELKDILKKPKDGISEKLTRYVDITEPAESVFVKTNKSMKFGVKDKLKYLFTSQKLGGSRVLKVEQLTDEADDCFEIYLLNWDAVLKTCKHTWTVEGQTLSVTPYFKGFKEPVKEQLQRLRALNKISKQAETVNKSYVSQEKPRNSSSVYAAPTNIQETHHSAESPTETQPVKQESLLNPLSNQPSPSHFTGSKEKYESIPTIKNRESDPDRKSDLKYAKPFFEHQYILMLLHLLNIEKAVQILYNTVTIKINETSWEVEILSPVSSLKIIQNMITKEDELDLPAHVENFLARKSVQEDLKAFIDSEELYLDIADVDGKLFLLVKDKAEREESFRDFVSTLVVTKDCFPLPSVQSKKNKKWKNFTASFQKTYSHQHIFVKDNCVTLLSLAHKTQDLDVILSIINNVIYQLKEDVTSDQTPGASFHKSESNQDTVSGANLVSNDSSQSSGDTSAEQSKTGSKSKTIIKLYAQHQFLLWILNVLNLQEAIEQYTNDLVVDINEEENLITIRGSTKAVKNLNLILMTEDGQFPVAEHDQELLSDVSVQEQLKSHLNESGHHIVLSDNFNIFVTNKDGEKVQFRTYVTDISKFRECSKLPEKYTKKEWKSLIENFKNNHPRCHILTADGNVYLLSNAFGKESLNTDHLVDEINESISSLTSNVPTDKIAGASKSSGHKKVIIVLKHPELLWILDHLHLKEAVKRVGVDVTINHQNCEISVKGPRNIVEDLRKILLTEDNELDLPAHVENFLARKSVQEDLKAFIDSEELYMDIADIDGKPFLLVKDKAEKEESFRDFVSSLVITKDCFPLPSVQSKKDKKWRNFTASFQKTYSHLHIFVQDNCVILLSLAHKSQDMEVILSTINNNISQLKEDVTSDQKPETSFHKSESNQDTVSGANLLSNDSSQSSGDASVERPKTGSKSKTVIKLYAQHPFLLWILNALNLQEAIKQYTNDLVVDINEKENMITIRGTTKAVKNLNLILMTEDRQFPASENEEEFLSDESVQQQLRSHLKESGHHIVLSDNFNISVTNKDEEEMPLWTFYTNIIVFRELSLPENYQITKRWELLKEHVKKTYPYHHIFATDGKVYLLAILLGEESHDVDKVVEDINRKLSFGTSLARHDSEMTDDIKPYEVSILCTGMKKQYFEQFLKDELRSIEKKYKNYRCEITITDNNICIHSDSGTMNNRMKEQLEQTLTNIMIIEKEFSFPGLRRYLTSQGSSLIKRLSEEHRCLIEIQDTSSAHPQRLSLNAEQSSESFVAEYKVLLLGTAQCSGFNIHLVQGDIQDLNIVITIELRPSLEDEKCNVKSGESSQNMIIELPPWKAPSDSSYHTHFEELRSSFQETVTLALIQAEHLHHTSISFSTAKLAEAERPFPVYVIAREIVKSLFQMYNSSSASQSAVDIYICDSGNEAVFKAFKFCLKQRQIYICEPDQGCWDSISCFQEPPVNCPDYRALLKSEGLEIEVLTSLATTWGSKGCIFYPIHPSLNIDTCAAVKDPSSVGWTLKSCLSDLQKLNPDGLLAGEILPLTGFYDGRHGFIYGCPNWGVDCGKIIERTLEACIMEASGFEEVCIIPPGMQMFSKYPKAYLIQKLFRKLDNLICSQQFLFQRKIKKIIFLVQDPVYKKAFDQELQKRYPAIKKEKGFIQTFKDWFTLGGNENTDQKNIPKIVEHKTQVPITSIAFCGKNMRDIQQAAQKLEKHLKDLMKENREVITLNREETSNFQNLQKDLQNLPVCISCEIEYGLDRKNKAKKKKKKKKKQNSENSPIEKVVILKSSLTVEGLLKNCVTELRNMVTGGRSTKKFDQLNPEVKQCDNTNIGGKSYKQQEKDCKLPVHGDINDDVPASESVQVASYKWMYELNADFWEIGPIGKEIEVAYSEENKHSKILQGESKFTEVNFTSMTVLENNTAAGIIRTEYFELPSPNFNIPGKWKPMPGKEFLLEKLESEEFEKIKELMKSLKGYNIVRVSQVQNKSLYTRFIQKLSQLKNKDHVFLWHKALNRYANQVCRYGFHPRFSGLPEGKQNLGDGVLFYKNPESCLNPQNTSDKEISLIYSEVLPGIPGPGRQGLRCPPLNEDTREPYDSVCENGAYMIFSDAQAYPVYLINIRIK